MKSINAALSKDIPLVWQSNKRDYVPLGESRLISRDGMVLEKFDLKEACG